MESITRSNSQRAKPNALVVSKHRENPHHHLSRSSKASSTSVSFLLASSFDNELIASQVIARQGVSLASSSIDLDEGLAQISQCTPDVIILDPSIHPLSMERVREAACREYLSNLIILDERIREGILLQALRMPRTSYLTRSCSVESLIDAIEQVAKTSEPVFDAECESRINRKAKTLESAAGQERNSISLLTNREWEVLKQVAQGISVRDCALRMEVAESTIDNHKSRIMKKLGVHKASQLTLLAIREGVILY